MAQEQRVKNALRNVVWSYIYSGIGQVFPFVIRTMIIRFLGMEYLGINSLFTAILQVINVSELGIGQALSISLYRPVAQKNDKLVSSLLSLYAYLYRILGLAVVVLGIILIPFLPWLTQGEYPEEINIVLVYLIYLLQSVATYWVHPYCNAAFMANQRLEIVNKYQSVVWIVIYTTQIIVIYCCRSYYLYIVLLPIASILCGCLNRIGMRRCFPEYQIRKIRKEDFDQYYLKKLFRNTGAMALSKIRVVFRSSFDTIVISTVIGIEMVAKYQNYILVMTVPLMLIGSLMVGILPTFGNGVALETKESNLEVNRLIAFLVHWISTIFAAFLLCFYQPFMKLWVGEAALLSDMSAILFVCYFYIRAMSEVNILARNGSGVWWEGKWIAVAESLMNLVLNVILVRVWGVEGIILATIVSMLVLNIPFETYYVYKYYYKASVRKDLIEYLKNAIISGIAVMGTYILSRLYSGNGIMAFLVWGLEALLFPNVVLIVFHCKNVKLKELMKIIAQALKGIQSECADRKGKIK